MDYDLDNRIIKVDVDNNDVEKYRRLVGILDLVSEANVARRVSNREAAANQVQIYNASGNQVATTQIDNHILWNTRRRDEVTGYYMYKFRHYSPELGRWLARDPIEEKGGVNLYAFVGNDPVGRWDRLGLKVRDPIDDDDFGAYANPMTRFSVSIAVIRDDTYKFCCPNGNEIESFSSDTYDKPKLLTSRKVTSDMQHPGMGIDKFPTGLTASSFHFIPRFEEAMKIDKDLKSLNEDKSVKYALENGCWKRELIKSYSFHTVFTIWFDRYKGKDYYNSKADLHNNNLPFHYPDGLDSYPPEASEQFGNIYID